jgi:diguanylate cyclase (GGDEF)-like protein/PAS domain S-box-containing protein
MLEERRVALLLVEDDEEDKFLTVEALRDVVGTTYDVTWVTTAHDAVRELTEGNYDVALLDFRLGAHTAIDILESVDTLTPCILLTGQRAIDTDFAAMRAGAADYIVKSELSSIDLERTIRYAIDRADDLRSVKESELRFRAVVEAATDAILLVKDDGTLATWNKAALSLFGMTEERASSENLLGLIAHQTGPAPHVGALTTMTDLVGVRTDTQHTFPVALSLSSWAGGNGRLWSAIVRDITWQREMEAQLVHQAFHDPLTGLANRALFADRVEHAIDRSSARAGEVAILFLDLDDFKRINDSFGHELGDELLCAVTQRLARSIGSGNTAARLGGDEFAVLIESPVDVVGAFGVAQSVMRALSDPMTIRGRTMQIGCSIGIAFTSSHSTTYSNLLRDADLAMYAAKAEGKNRVSVFDSSMHSRIMERLDLELELGSAITNQEIEAHYQPIFDLATGRIKGFEALARWGHPTRGLLFPNTFIDVAEASGAIVQIGAQMLTLACAQTKRWQDLYPAHHDLSVSVNVSGRQFHEPSVVTAVEGALATSGLAPERLVVEITETLVVDQSGPGHDHLRQIADLGVSIAIDDFGTGYSSLSYLQDLPIGILKVDRSFVNRSDDRRGAELVKAIVSMSHSLGLATTAEGIESTEQLGFLRELGCNFGQGYLFSKPMPVESVPRFFEQSRVPV